MSKKRNPSRVSASQLRSSFQRVLAAIKAGRCVTVTYRNKPFARIVPLTTPQKRDSNQPFCLADVAEPMGKLSNSELDALIYRDEGCF